MIIHLRKTYTIFMQSLRYHFFKWRIIGQGLGFTDAELTNIVAVPSHQDLMYVSTMQSECSGLLVMQQRLC